MKLPIKSPIARTLPYSLANFTSLGQKKRISTLISSPVKDSFSWLRPPLATPLIAPLYRAAGMEEAFKEYQATFSELAITEEKLPAYVTAKKKLEEYLPFEASLVSYGCRNMLRYVCI